MRREVTEREPKRELEQGRRERERKKKKKKRKGDGKRCGEERRDGNTVEAPGEKKGGSRRERCTRGSRDRETSPRG